MRFGHWLGGAFLAIGVLFAVIDSIILFKGWAAYGLDYWDQISYGTAAASIPWTIVGFPFVFWLMWLRGRWRAVFPIIVALAVYCILLGYSLIGALGSIATQRGQVIAAREATRESTDALKDQRNRYRNELGWIAKHRPPDQVAAAIEAEKIKRQWDWTDGCKDIRNSSQRTYCTNLAALQGELAAARKSEELHQRIAELSAQIDGRKPVAEKADPMAATLASWLGIDEHETTLRLPLATPLVLLIGEMVFVWFGFLLLGIDHRRLIAGGMEVPRASALLAERGEAVGVGGELVAAPSLPPPSPHNDPATRGRQLAAWFFAECTRPVASGGLPEGDWYALYRAECAKSNDVPVSIEEFRALAKQHGAALVLIDGQWFYQRVLPLVPKEGAA